MLNRSLQSYLHFPGVRRETHLHQVGTRLNLDNRMANYLKMALISGQNMMIRADSNETAYDVFDALYGFLPRYQRNMILSDAHDRIRLETLVRGTFIDTKVTGADAAMRHAIAMGPYRIILENSTRRLGPLFSYASGGGIFAVLIDGWAKPEALPEYLLRFKRVRTEDLSNLDLLVELNGEEHELALYEYRWLSRAETESGRVVRDCDMLELMKVAGNGLLDMNSMMNSKVLRPFSVYKGISMEEAVELLDTGPDATL